MKYVAPSILFALMHEKLMEQLKPVLQGCDSLSERAGPDEERYRC